MKIILNLMIVCISSILIFFLGKHFAQISSRLGDYFQLSKSVKGATFDAIASSMPELFIALFSVIFFKKFEIGIGTIAGSALFNLLVIPGVCILISPKLFKVDRQVIDREVLFYIVSVFILFVLLLYFRFWGFLVSIILISVYFLYLREIIYDNEKKKDLRIKPGKINLKREIFLGLFILLGLGIATYFLTDASINLANSFGVSSIVIAFTITAAATSIPDMVISVVNAKKGSLDDAASNVFGSNIFNILIGLGLPLLIYSIFVGPVQIMFGNLEIIIGLLGSAIMILYLFSRRETISKKKAWFLILLYIVFVFYVVFIS